MKISKKLRMLFSLTSLLICVCMGSFAVYADTVDTPTEEATTSKDSTVLYANGKISLADAESIVEQCVSQLSQMATCSYDEMKYLGDALSYQTDMYANFAATVGEDGCGKYINYDPIKVEENEDKSSVVITTIIHFKEKDITATFNVSCFGVIGNTVTSTEFGLADEAEEGMASKLESAGANTLMGMGTVFVVLILISLIISCFTFIPKIQAKFEKKDNKVREEDKKELKKEIAAVDAESVTDDTELIAVIAAAIAASENTTTDSFVVRSIRRR